MYKLTIRLPSGTKIYEESDKKKAENMYQDICNKEKSYHITFENIKEVSSNEKK